MWNTTYLDTRQEDSLYAHEINEVTRTFYEFVIWQCGLQTCPTDDGSRTFETLEN
jgi:hypothetical protein